MSKLSLKASLLLFVLLVIVGGMHCAFGWISQQWLTSRAVVGYTDTGEYGPFSLNTLDVTEDEQY